MSFATRASLRRSAFSTAPSASETPAAALSTASGIRASSLRSVSRSASCCRPTRAQPRSTPWTACSSLPTYSTLLPACSTRPTACSTLLPVSSSRESSSLQQAQPAFESLRSASEFPESSSSQQPQLAAGSHRVAPNSPLPWFRYRSRIHPSPYSSTPTYLPAGPPARPVLSYRARYPTKPFHSGLSARVASRLHHECSRCSPSRLHRRPSAHPPHPDFLYPPSAPVR